MEGARGFFLKRLLAKRVSSSGLPWIVVSDFDGVLTPGNFFYSESGKVLKEFGSHDADAIKYFNKRGLDFNFVTADHRGFEISRKRVEDMGFHLQLLTPEERCSLIRKLQATNRVVYVGDSLTDLQGLMMSDIAVVPAGAFGLDGIPGALYLRRGGGHGAIAELLFTLFDKDNFQQS